MPFSRRDFQLIAVVCLIGAACYLPALGQDVRWGSHEARHAQIAREMALTGRMMVLRIGGRPSPALDKPPLFHWLVAASYMVCGGVNEFSMRLPSALSAIAGGVGVFLLGRLLADRWVGFVAALLLMTTASYAEWALMCRMDVFMSAAMLFAALFAAYAARAQRGWARWVHWGVGTLFWSAAVLSKGTPALGVGLLMMVLTWLCLAEKKWMVLPLLGLSLALGGALFWAWVSLAEDKGYLATVLRYQFGMTVAENRGPWYYYFTRLPLRFLPHVLWLPSAIWLLLARWRRERRWEDLYPLVVFAAGFVVFSVATTKRHHYALPLAPFSCLIVARFMVQRLREPVKEGRDRLFLIPAAIWFVLALLAAFALAFGHEGSPGPGLAALISALALALALSAMGLRYAILQRTRATLVVALALAVALPACVHQAAVMFYWRQEPPVRLARRVAAAVRPGVPVGLGVVGRDEISFGLLQIATAVDTAEEAAEYAATPGEKYLVASPDFLPSIQAKAGARAREEGRWRLGKRKWVMLVHVAAAGGPDAKGAVQ